MRTPACSIHCVGPFRPRAIAASALGRRITDLEHAFGTALLVRSPRGIALTDAGRLVLTRGIKIDEDLEALARECDVHTDLDPMLDIQR